MNILRLVVTGPVGAGKSTFIRSASDIEAVDTDCRVTNGTGRTKRKTTTALDFGRRKLTHNLLIHLYGTPGQARFEFMWDILIRKAHVYMLLVAAHRPEDFDHARRMLSFMQRRSPALIIIGITHMDKPEAQKPERVVRALGYNHNQSLPPIISVNADDPKSVNRAVMRSVKSYGRQLKASKASHLKQSGTPKVA